MRTHTGESLIVANSASIPAQLQVISRSTCSLFQRKNHSVALSAPIPAQQVVQQHMTTYSGEKHFSCAQCKYSCNNAGGLKKHILEKNRLHAISATYLTGIQHNTFREEVFHLWPVQLFMQPCWCSQDTHAAAFWRKTVLMQLLLQKFKIWGLTCFPTLVRNPLLAINAITRAYSLFILGWHMKKHPLRHQH